MKDFVDTRFLLEYGDYFAVRLAGLKGGQFAEMGWAGEKVLTWQDIAYEIGIEKAIEEGQQRFDRTKGKHPSSVAERCGESSGYTCQKIDNRVDKTRFTKDFEDQDAVKGSLQAFDSDISSFIERLKVDDSKATPSPNVVGHKKAKEALLRNRRDQVTIPLLMSTRGPCHKRLDAKVAWRMIKALFQDATKNLAAVIFIDEATRHATIAKLLERLFLEENDRRTKTEKVLSDIREEWFSALGESYDQVIWFQSPKAIEKGRRLEKRRMSKD
ncbi:MAG: hypothetical protein M1819_000669 [Sarea resinae]|nr:MAG: hypothetical protein M1819_000669 [Sarea resinae]